MSLSNNYFLLYHGTKIEKKLEFHTKKRENDSDFLEILALVLVPTKDDIEKFITLSSFNELCLKITDFCPKNIEELNQLQYELLELIEQNKNIEEFKAIKSTLNHLYNEEIISQNSLNKLTSLFEEDLINEKTEVKNIENNKSFKESKKEFQEILGELKDIFNSSNIEDLEQINSYLENQKFSIGITGIMNAGKSTMLNALMGEEILGSAVVPETANLTIVKKGEKSKAKVFYWNKKEWENIEKTSQDIPSIKTFIDEAKATFKDELSNYIQENSKSEEIDVKSLANYTSADKSGKKCNLVKYVVLESNLNFLNDGVEIVDTPGLDDPVIQREEITKEYISKCDLMLHLMNVSQSATLKDVEFIIDALLYQNITKLLVVITRADTVSKKELEEVINYTKNSIKKQLELQNKNSKLDYILNTIKFIPISGKMALLHRIGKEKEALQNGFKLEDTGILDIENYLEETLFGSNSTKSDLIVKSINSQILKVCEKRKKSLEYELLLLGKSKDELQDELKEFTIQKQESDKILKIIQNDINTYKIDAKEYLNRLETFINDELIDLQNIIKQRVFGDVKYSYQKDKRKPENSRIKVIAQTAIKDGIVDIIRDYRYKFIKKSQDIGEIAEQKYHSLGFVLSHKNDNFDARGFLQDEFKSGFLTSSNDILINKIIQELASVKESKLELFDTNIQKHIKYEFDQIKQNIKTKIKLVSQNLLENFFIQLQEPLKIFEQKVLDDEKMLKQRVENFEQTQKNKDKKVATILENIKKLDAISKRVEG